MIFREGLKIWLFKLGPLPITTRQKWANSSDTWIHSSDAGKIPSSRPVIGQAADTSQSQACYWEFFLHHLSGSKCLNYFPTFGGLWLGHGTF